MFVRECRVLMQEGVTDAEHGFVFVPVLVVRRVHTWGAAEAGQATAGNSHAFALLHADECVCGVPSTLN